MSATRAGGAALAAAGRTARRPAVWTVAAAVLVLAGLAAHLYMGRDQVPFAEDLDWALEHRGLTTGMLELYVGWFDPLARLAYNVVFATAGLDGRVWFGLIAAACNAALAVAVLAYGRHLGRPWSGFAVALALLWMGPALYTIIWPLNALNAAGMAALPAALVLLGRGTRRGDLLAMGALLLAVGFGGPVAVGVCLGIGAWTLAGPAPERWRRSMVPAVPLGVYALAFLTLPGPRSYGDGGGDPADIPGFVLDAGVASVAALGAQLDSLARVVPPASAYALAGLAALALVVGWPRLDTAARRRVLACAVCAVAQWALVGLSRAQFESPAASRYLILGAVPLLLIGIELTAVADVRLAAAAGAALLLATGANALLLSDNARDFRLGGRTIAAEFAAFELRLDHLAPDHRVPAEWRVAFVTPQVWRETLARIGPSFAPTPEEIPALDDHGRAVVDRALLDLGAAGLSVTAGDAPRAGCTPLATPIDTRPVPAGGAVVLPAAGATQVGLVRFGAAADPARTLTLTPGSQAVVSVSADAAPQPWRVQVLGGGRLCPA